MTSRVIAADRARPERAPAEAAGRVPEPCGRRRAALPRSAILRGLGSFNRVFNGGLAVRNGHILVKYLADPARPRCFAVGFVTRRGTGTAVRRNRIKRLLREAYRLERAAFEASVPTLGLQFVIVWGGTREDVMRATLGSVRPELAGALRRIAHRLRHSENERADRP